MSKINCDDPTYIDKPNSKVCGCLDRVKNVIGKAVQNKEFAYLDPNKNLSKCECGDDRVKHVIREPKTVLQHPIVNLCQQYVESVLFQLDSAPNTNAIIAFNNDKKGRIIKFTYFLDSSAGDAVTVFPEKVSANLGKEALINYVQGGNTFIKGTFNTQALEFNLNMKIENDEKVQLTIQNASANDVTIMAVLDIKYGEEDWE